MLNLKSNTENILKTINNLEFIIINNNLLQKGLNPYYTQQNSKERALSISTNNIRNELNYLKYSDFKNIPKLQVLYKNIGRNIHSLEEILDFLIQQFEYVKLEEKKEYIDVKTIDYGIVPTKKSWPRYSIVGVVIFIVIFSITFIYCYVRDVIINKRILIV